MIAFGCVIGDDAVFDRFARPGIELVAEPDTELILRRDQTNIYAAYNGIFDEALTHPDLEAVVLLHHDLEIADREFMPKLRAAIAEPGVAIVGVVGGRGVHGAMWWKCDLGIGGFNHAWTMDRERELEFSPDSFWFEYQGRSGDVDIVDGMIMAFPAWTLRELRFDETVAPGFHGYDSDICLAARNAGHRVYVAEIGTAHHNDAALPDGPEFREAYAALRIKWGERLAS